MHNFVLLVAGAIFGALAGKMTEWCLDWYKSTCGPKIPKLVKAADIAAWGWNARRLLKELILLDRAVLGNELTSDSREGTVDQWAPLFTRDTEGWAALAVSKRLVGYFSFFALNVSSYEQAQTGTLLDSQVTLESTIAFDSPGIYKAYFVLLGVRPEYPGAGKRLLDAFFDQVKSLAERGVFFEDMLANAFTPYGKRLCEGFGMAKLRDHTDFGEVYHLRLHPWPTCLDHKRWHDIKELYKGKLTQLGTGE